MESLFGGRPVLNDMLLGSMEHRGGPWSSGFNEVDRLTIEGVMGVREMNLVNELIVLVTEEQRIVSLGLKPSYDLEAMELFVIGIKRGFEENRLGLVFEGEEKKWDQGGMRGEESQAKRIGAAMKKRIRQFGHKQGGRALCLQVAHTNAEIGCLELSKCVEKVMFHKTSYESITNFQMRGADKRDLNGDMPVG